MFLSCRCEDRCNRLTYFIAIGVLRPCVPPPMKSSMACCPRAPLHQSASGRSLLSVHPPTPLHSSPHPPTRLNTPISLVLGTTTGTPQKHRRLAARERDVVAGSGVGGLHRRTGAASAGPFRVSRATATGGGHATTKKHLVLGHGTIYEVGLFKC